MRKRLLAFLLSLCMIFSLLPVTAFAVDVDGGFHTENEWWESDNLSLSHNQQ